MSGETQSTQSASEAAKRMCSEQKQQLEEQKQRLEEQKQRLVEHKQGLRSRISQLNERVKQLEADLESEKRRASDQRFTSQRLIRQLDQKQRLQQQALERAAQCPDKQNNQSSPQSRSLPTTSQASALRSDVMAFQQKDREVLPVGSRIRRTDGRVDDTKANETGLAASQWGSRMRLDQEGFSHGRDGQSTSQENIRGHYGHEETTEAQHAVSRTVSPAERDAGGIRHGPLLSPQSGEKWMNESRRPESPVPHTADTAQNPEELRQRSAHDYERRSRSKSVDQLVLPPDSSSHTQSDAFFRHRMQTDGDGNSTRQELSLGQNYQSVAQPVDVDQLRRGERPAVEQTKAEQSSTQDQQSVVAT